MSMEIEVWGGNTHLPRPLLSILEKRGECGGEVDFDFCECGFEVFFDLVICETENGEFLFSHQKISQKIPFDFIIVRMTINFQNKTVFGTVEIGHKYPGYVF